MRAFYSDRYVIALPEGHRFPIIKYAMIRHRLGAEKTLAPSQVAEPPPAARDEILLVHTADYYDRLEAGRLTERELRRLGLPWSEALVGRSRISVAGTVCAARAALLDGVGANIGGGTHHAFAGHGEGFCVLNDIAVAIRALRAEGLIRRAAVVDCDVHQGNGTAAIFASDPEVFTLSLHGEKNYPLLKQQSTVDVPLADRTGDEEYLGLLSHHLAVVLDRFRPDVVFYQSGVDPYRDDRLGRLALTFDGLKRRDLMVFQQCRSRSVPCVITLGGGYARQVADTVEAHCNTMRAARAVYGP
ncbi:MAG TPA: histone deacetylase [Blastocatellia bacterium]|jgi:acetoin utilization deacetylase AcuC-like enzyme|nr:histone deacetylase [Blastocatellia bacterium]